MHIYENSNLHARCNLLTRKYLIYFHQEIAKVGDELGIVPVIIKGEQLNQQGFGGTFCSEFYFAYIIEGKQYKQKYF